MYQQDGGAGIGERSSAVLAKVTMAIWDILWTNAQRGSNLIVHMYFRYIDDLRILLAPINPGWTWTNKEWYFNKDMKDDRSMDQRTKEEILKSLNDVINDLDFTVETQDEYESGYMPTLDTQTKVGNDRMISFKYYSKPMASNLVIQLGTALSQQTVFTSLRQDLCRRLGNTGTMEGHDVKLEVIEDFIQQLSNSGHKFQFIKSVVLQAITRHEYMLERDRLNPSNKKYCPMYRPRSYKQIERIMIKRVGAFNWFTNETFDDPFKQGWKGRIRRKGQFKNKRMLEELSIKKKNCKIAITTKMFIPPTPGSKLLKKLMDVEDIFKQNRRMEWGVKLVEKSGVSLINTLRIR